MKARKSGIFQFSQFGIVGLVNAGVDIGSLNLLLLIWPTNDNGTLILFNTISYILAIINSYFWNSRFTFKQHATFNGKEKLYFILQAAASLMISNIVFISGIYLFLLFPIPQWLIHNLSKGLAMILSSTASFFFMKYIVFHKGRRMHE
jgi:putative flippase GtrA